MCTMRSVHLLLLCTVIGARKRHRNETNTDSGPAGVQAGDAGVTYELDAQEDLQNLSSVDALAFSFIDLQTARYMNEVHLGEGNLVDNLRDILNLPPNKLRTRFGDESFVAMDISSSSDWNPQDLAEPALCEPELVTVPIKIENITSSIFFYPTCTRMYQCGGCCSHPRLSCLPTDKRIERKMVILLDMETGKESREIVNMEQHVACKCSCTVQPHHCTSLQIHVEDECRCRCMHKKTCSPDKEWNEDSCSCQCKKTGAECSTGFKYSLRSCRCEPAYRRLTPHSSTSRPPISHNRNEYWKMRRRWED